MNKQTIGFDRELQLSWLDLTAGLAQEGIDIQQIRPKLQDILANEIPGSEACRKTVTLLTRLWIRVPTEHQILQSEALNLLANVLPEERLWLHWGMSMLAYPFFFKVASTVGHLLKLQGEFESTQVRQRIRESWGQRTTLDRAINRVIQTYLIWDVLQQTTKPRVYQAVQIRKTENKALAVWFMESIIQAIRQSSNQKDRQIPLTELIQSSAIFPFDLTPHIITLRRSDNFYISHQGLDMEMVSSKKSPPSDY